ncbi:hypothetical protein V565_089410 [Rhizoctonia solani 123E]|uniref:Uncharacterized protein n=1 Tax=Rhizoctonia solani 123E TaxID=1423351 RepID=A0A074RXB6_9AGAM|nr:hypothetical protein V565_089410 [Rhizoctonia solani 123E]
MGRLHFSSAEKYQKAAEPACEVPNFPTWGDQSFDPEAEILSGHMMVYEAFLDKDGRPPLPDDADAISDVSEESSSAATDEEEYPTLRRVPRMSLVPPPITSVVAPPSAESGSTEFEDFVRIEVPRSDHPESRPSTLPRPSSPLRNSITTGELAERSADAASQRDEEEHLFNYYQNYTGGSHERTHYPTRIFPLMESRMSQTRRVPGHPRFLPRADGHRAPLANPPVVEHLRPVPRPRSASVSDARTSEARVPERWHSAVDGTILSSRILAQR